jgi:hypothetical protein
MQVPFYNSYISYFWCGVWFAVTFAACLNAYLEFNWGNLSLDRSITLVSRTKAQRRD